MTKNTKKAVWASALSILMCLSLLIGTTFAWFTDTASTSVNKIQAGKLDVALEYATAWNDDGSVRTWANAEGETLNFRTSDNRAEILWEPGCTYELPALRVVNKGDLALKYKVIITGINGDAKLNEAIEWTINNAPINLTEQTLAVRAESAAFVIKGHMKEDAGNEYQGLSIDGISITVVATQVAVEYDSTGNQYDASAVLPVYAQAVGNLTVADGSQQNDATVATDQTISDSVMTVTYPGGVKLNATSAIEDNTTTVKQKFEYKGDKPSSAMGSVTIEGGKSVASYELTLPVAENNAASVTVTIKYTKGLTGVQIYHSGVLLTATANADGESATYNAGEGVITLVLKHASPIDILYNNVLLPENAEVVNTLDELKDALADGAEYIVIGADIDMTGSGGSEQVIALNDCTIDLNGHKINGSVWSGSYLSTADGTRLTLTDSGNGGEIYSTFRFGEYGAMMQANAVTAWQHAVTINGGTYQSNNVAIVCQVQNTNAAEGVIINGGTFKGSNDLIEGVSLPGPVGGCVEAVIGTVTINGGTFAAAQYGSVIIAESGSSNCDTVVNIHGGTFSGACMFDFGEDHSSKSIINVYGGDFTVKSPDGTALKATNFAYDNVTHAALVNNDMFELNIMGGTFNMDPSAYVDMTKYTVTNNGTTWTVTAKKRNP